MAKGRSRTARSGWPLRGKALITTVGVVVGGVAAFLANTSAIREFLGTTFAAVDLPVTVDLIQEPPVVDESVEGLAYPVHYSQSKVADGLRIRYASAFFTDSVANEVGILGDGPYFSLPKIGLDVKLTNNKARTVYVTEARFNVASSDPDNRPLIMFAHNVGVIGGIFLINDGWGNPDKIRLRASLRLEGRDDEPLVDLPLSGYAGDGEEYVDYFFGIDPLVAPYGVELERALEVEDRSMAIADRILRIESSRQTNSTRSLIQRLERESEDLEEERTRAWADVHVPCVRNIPAPAMSEEDGEYHGLVAVQSNEELRRFPYGCEVKVAGDYSYEWREGNELRSKMTVFTTWVSVSPPEGLGAPGFEPTGTYDVELKASDRNYQLSLPLSQPIENGKVDRFVLWIGAPRSSRHRFVVHFRLSDGGEISTPPIDLDYFMPRANRDYLVSEGVLESKGVGPAGTQTPGSEGGEHLAGAMIHGDKSE